MKTPIWEASAGATLALLATRSFVFADLYTITPLFGGAALRDTTADIDMSDGVHTYSHGGPLFDQAQSAGSRPVAHWKVGLDVDTWNVVIQPRTVDPITGAAYPDRIGALPWAAAARAGFLDGAVVTVDRAILPAWPSWPFTPPAVPTGVLRVFAGRVAEMDVGRTQITMALNSHLELLGMQMPRNLYQAPCTHILFDAGCTLAAAAFGVGGSIAAATAGAVIYAGVSPPAGSSGTFALGRVTMTSGQSAGLSRSVRAWGAGWFQLLAPFPFAPQPGDTLTAWPGCDKSMATCTGFGNVANFGGCPFIPAPELAV